MAGAWENARWTAARAGGAVGPARVPRTTAMAYPYYNGGSGVAASGRTYLGTYLDSSDDSTCSSSDDEAKAAASTASTRSRKRREDLHSAHTPSAKRQRTSANTAQSYAEIYNNLRKAIQNVYEDERRRKEEAEQLRRRQEAELEEERRRYEEAKRRRRQQEERRRKKQEERRKQEAEQEEQRKNLPAQTPDELRSTLLAAKDAYGSRVLRSRDFDAKFDYVYTAENCRKIYTRRGGTDYSPPLGCTKLGLRVLDKFSDNTWLDRDTGWQIAFHGTRARPADIASIIRDGFKVRGGHSKARHGEMFGPGIYCTPDVEFAKTYARGQPLPVGGDSLMLVVACRVHPGRFIEQTYPTSGLTASTVMRAGKPIWVVRKERHIRPFALLFSK